MLCFVLKNLVHYGLHFVFPLAIAFLFYRKDWLKTYLLLLATMAVDVDHLLADPIFDPARHSVGFHYLHSYPAILIYIIFFVFGKGIWRILALGLLLHMITDFQDSLWFC